LPICLSRQLRDTTRARYGGTYYLVEANPVLAEALRVEGSFPVWHCAVAATEGPIPFHIAHNDTGSSLLTLPRESVYNCVLHETVQVQAKTLESLLTEIRAPRIDLLKMDIEGAEVMVLRSLSGATLRAIGQITVEFHSDPVFGFDLRRDVEEVIRSLQRHGFLCVDFSGTSRLDVLFVNCALHRIPWLQRMMWEFWTPPRAGSQRSGRNCPHGGRAGCGGRWMGRQACGLAADQRSRPARGVGYRHLHAAGSRLHRGRTRVMSFDERLAERVWNSRTIPSKP
jgi:FkbM family methyltransferase